MSTEHYYKPPRADALPPPRQAASEIRFRAIYAAGAVVALGLFSNACWFFEVVWLKGWEGLSWLDGFPIAAFPVCVCAAVSTLIPVLRRRRVGAARAAVFVLGAALVSLTSFAVARAWFLRGKWWFLGRPSWQIAIAPTVSVLLTAAGLLGLARLLPERPSRIFLPLAAAAVLLTHLMSYLTIQVFPAINHDTDYIHSVKMGYPTFWVNVLLALAMTLALRWTKPPAPRPETAPEE